MPYSGTIQHLTFNLFSILADQHLSANALFWITVWITATGHGPPTLSRVSGTASSGSSIAAPASWTPNRGYLGWLLDLDRIGWRGGGLCSGCLLLGPKLGGNRAEAVASDFVWAWS